MAILSALVARDSARVAVEGPEAIYVIVDEVNETIIKVEAFLDELAAFTPLLFTLD